MVNLHDLYLNTIEGVLNARNLDVAHQPAGDKPSGVLWAMPKGTTKPEAIITYVFEPTLVSFCVASRDMGRSVNHTTHYSGGIEGFLDVLVKFIGAGRLAAPK